MFDQVGAFAKPVQRKEKKGLDFKRWRDIMDGGDSSVSQKQVENKHVKSEKQNKVGRVTDIADGLETPVLDSDKEHSCRIPSDAEAKTAHLDVEDRYSTTSEVVNDQEQDMSYVAMDIECALPVQKIGESNDVTMKTKEKIFTEAGLRSSRLDYRMQVDKEMQYMSTNSKASALGSYKLIDENGERSLESQIDAENRARLEKMSADEIAEAHAEIMEKMNPALVDALRKRGLEKLKRKQNSGSDMAVDNESRKLKEEKDSINVSTVSDNACSQRAMDEDLKGKTRDLDNDSTPSFTSKSSSMWDLWSKRVEDVRDLRFSLDGNIIKSAEVAYTGKAKIQLLFPAILVPSLLF